MIKLLALVCICFSASCRLEAQSFENDFAHLNHPQTSHESVQVNKKSVWNPLSLSYQLGIKFYQKVISEQLATSCAFEITCSRFSSSMVRDYGFVKGYFLSFDRLSRCSRISTMETLPIRLSQHGKIIEAPVDFHIH